MKTHNTFPPINPVGLVASLKAVSSMKPDEVEAVLEEADREISVPREGLKSFVLGTCYDRDILESAGMNYSKVDSRKVKAGVAYYLLNA